MSALVPWLPDHQQHVLYTLAHVDATIDHMARTLEAYLDAPGPLTLQSRWTESTEEVVLTNVAPLPQSVARLFADALNQLRNVLEHSLTAEVTERLPRDLTPDESRAIEMPSTSSPDAFAAWTRHKHRKSHGMFVAGADLHERLDRLQPWHRKDPDLHPLRRLVAFTNAAKHQAPAIATVGVGKVLLDTAPRDVEQDASRGFGEIGSVLVSVRRGTTSGVSVWPQVAVRRPHTGELRTLMWEARDLEEWVRRIALPLLIAGRTDLPDLPPNLDIDRGYVDHQAAWAAAKPFAAAVRAAERLKATALRGDLIAMMVETDGETTRRAYEGLFSSMTDREIVDAFEPLGEAARARDLAAVTRITASWRSRAQAL